MLSILLCFAGKNELKDLECLCSSLHVLKTEANDSGSGRQHDSFVDSFSAVSTQTFFSLAETSAEKRFFWILYSSLTNNIFATMARTSETIPGNGFRNRDGDAF